ncbi:hypothetical protein LXL04_026852 [Taraxacum kok-saghyz]
MANFIYHFMAESLPKANYPKSQKCLRGAYVTTSPPSELLFQASVMEVRRWQNSPEQSRAGRFSTLFTNDYLAARYTIHNMNDSFDVFRFDLTKTSSQMKVPIVIQDCQDSSS